MSQKYYEKYGFDASMSNFWTYSHNIWTHELEHARGAITESFNLKILFLQVKQDMDIVHDSVNSNLEELKSKVNTLINSDIASSTRWLISFVLNQFELYLSEK